MTSSFTNLPNIVVIGLGPVGLTTVATLAEFGLPVTGLEQDASRFSVLQSGKIPYHEAGLAELIAAHLQDGRITFTRDADATLAAAEIVFLCVGTPKKGDGYEPDLSQVYGAVQQVLDSKTVEAAHPTTGTAGNPGSSGTAGNPGSSDIASNSNTAGSTGSQGASDIAANTDTAGNQTEAQTDKSGLLNASRPVIIVEKSTVPPGTGTAIEQHFANHETPFEIVSNPEFLREGTAVWDTLFPDRVVVGTNSTYSEGLMRTIYDHQQAYHREHVARRSSTAQTSDSAEEAKDTNDALKKENLVATLFDLANMPDEIPCIFTDRNTAELIKHASNSFLATKISYINLIARVCEATGANIETVAYGMGLDQRISPQFLRAGLGYGGSCFPKDIRALIHTAQSFGIDPGLLNQVETINEVTKLWPIQQLENELGTLEHKTICVLGYAFKPGTDDVREAPAIDLVTALLAKGASIRLTDPVALESEPQLWEGQSVERITDHHEAIKGCDAAVLATEWPDFTDISPTEMAECLTEKLLVDARNLYDFTIYSTGGILVKTIGNKH